MSVVAPVSGLMAALVPAAAGMALGDRLSATALVGIGLCLVAILFVSMEKTDGPVRRLSGPLLAVAAGTGFGAFFVFIRQATTARCGRCWPRRRSAS